MANILDYIEWRGDIPFSTSQFNIVDAMILCEVAYFPLEGIVPFDLKESIGWDDMCQKVIVREELSIHDERDTLLAQALMESTRYDGIKVTGFINDVNVEKEKQFSAVTFQLNKKEIFVAFRGTDKNLIGWKENMDLAYNDEVPAQKVATKYLNDVLKFFKKKAIVAGHSKGGNLAVYSSAFCSEKLFKFVQQVYNFDGPGFNHVVVQNPNFERILPKVKTFVPQSSIIGMLLEHKEEKTIIQSSESNGFSQHALFTWEIKKNDLIYLDDFTETGKYTNENISGWIERMSFDEKEQFIDSIFKLLDKNKKVGEIFTAKNILPILKNYKDMSAEDKKNIKEAIGDLKDTVIENIRERIDL